jgi:hypothetical protein
MESEADLMLIVQARSPICCHADLLYRRQEETDEQGDDGDNHQHLDEGESATHKASGDKVIEGKITFRL